MIRKSFSLALFALLLFTQLGFGAERKTTVLFTADSVLLEDYQDYVRYQWPNYVKNDTKLYRSKFVLVEYQNSSRRLYLNLYEIDKAAAAKKFGEEKPEEAQLLAFASEKKSKTRYGWIRQDGYSKSGGNSYQAVISVRGKEYELSINDRRELTAWLDGSRFYGSLVNPKVVSDKLWKATKPLNLTFEQRLKRKDYSLLSKLKKAFKENDISLFYEHNIPKELDNLNWRFKLLSSDQRRDTYKHFDDVKTFLKKEIKDYTWSSDINDGSYLFVRRKSDKAAIAIVGQFGIEAGDYGDCGAAVLTPMGKSDYTMIEFECD